MTLTDRDRKIMFAFIPVLVLAAYWFLLLAPKRQDASAAADALQVQQERVNVARDKAQAASGAKEKFQTTYAQVVRLGKAIPTEVDMPSLLVQLDKAAEGTSIRFTKIKTGARTTGAAAATTTSAAPAAGSESGTNGSPVAAGGQQAQSAPGGAVESANNAQQTSNQASSAAENSGVQPSDTQTSTTAGATDTSGQATGTAPVGLDTVPLELEFDGDFFNLADFFHDVKRFVSEASNNVTVSGRLVTIEGIRWSSDQDLFPKIKAEIDATIYLAPKTQGATAGATPTGPAPATPTTTTDQSTPASTPTATATP